MTFTYRNVRITCRDCGHVWQAAFGKPCRCPNCEGERGWVNVTPMSCRPTHRETKFYRPVTLWWTTSSKHGLASGDAREHKG